MNNVDDASSQIALDHTGRSFNVLDHRRPAVQPRPRPRALRGDRRHRCARPIRPTAPTSSPSTASRSPPRSASRRRSTSTTSCAIPPTDPLFQQPHGPRLVRRQRHVPHRSAARRPGFDPATNVSVTSYVVRFHKDGFADQCPRRQRAVAQRGAPARRGHAARSRRGCGSRRSGRTPRAARRRRRSAPPSRCPASSTTPPRRWPRCPGSATGGLTNGGSFDTGADDVQVRLGHRHRRRPGFPTHERDRLAGPVDTAATTLEDVVFDVDPTNPRPTLLTARLRMTPMPRTVSGRLQVTCCNVRWAAEPADHPAGGGVRLAAGAAARRHGTTGAPTFVAPLTSTGTYSTSNVPPGHYTLTFAVDPTNDPHLIAGNIDLPAPLAVDVSPNLRHLRARPQAPGCTRRRSPATCSTSTTATSPLGEADGRHPRRAGGARRALTEDDHRRRRLVHADRVGRAARPVAGDQQERRASADHRPVRSRSTPAQLIPVRPRISGPKGGIAGEVRGRDNTARRRRHRRSAA